MRYPEGETVQVGDLIWWNEGVCIGFVLEVTETESECAAMDLDDPGILVTNLHPYEANLTADKCRLPHPCAGGRCRMPLNLFEDEGIGLLSEHEKEAFYHALSTARSEVTPELRLCPFCARAELDQAKGEKDWYFDFLNEALEIVETIRIPFQPGTRIDP